MSQTTGKTDVVRLVRIVNAPADIVYNAFVDPDQIARWYGPEGSWVTDVESDPRPGGQFRALMKREEGDRGYFYGEYRELIPGELIVMTWGWENLDGSTDADPLKSSILRVELREQGSGTELTLIHELSNRTAGGVEGVNEGWTGALDRFVAVFEGS